jgi:hypothetical protein
MLKPKPKLVFRFVFCGICVISAAKNFCCRPLVHIAKRRLALGLQQHTKSLDLYMVPSTNRRKPRRYWDAQRAIYFFDDVATKVDLQRRHCKIDTQTMHKIRGQRSLYHFCNALHKSSDAAPLLGCAGVYIFFDDAATRVNPQRRHCEIDMQTMHEMRGQRN